MPPLTADQVFQLNTLLWSLTDVHPEGGIHPVLRDAGYFLRAIGQRVQVPRGQSQLTALQAVTESQDASPTRPDLWLGHSDAVPQVLVELKAQSFGPNSSNQRQASKLILSAADLASSLGSPAEVPGHVCYLTPADQAAAMAETLKSLAAQILHAGGDVAPTGALGLEHTEDGVLLGSPHPDDLPYPLRHVLSTPKLVLEAPDGDNSIQPLYYIPWIPGIEDSQDPILAADGLRELTARVLTHAMAALGTARPPQLLMVSGADLLDGATLGIFSYWREADADRFAEAAAKIVERALSATVTVRRQQWRLEIELPTAELQRTAIERLEDADPSDPAKSLATVVAEPPTLF